MKTKHTQGPWEYSTDFEGLCRVKAHNQKTGLAICETEANARLIAASPELLEIAKAYRNLLKTMAHTEGEVATYQHIQDVIAKVEGRE